MFESYHEISIWIKSKTPISSNFLFVSFTKWIHQNRNKNAISIKKTKTNWRLYIYCMYFCRMLRQTNESKKKTKKYSLCILFLMIIMQVHLEKNVIAWHPPNQLCTVDQDKWLYYTHGLLKVEVNQQLLLVADTVLLWNHSPLYASEWNYITFLTWLSVRLYSIFYF